MKENYAEQLKQSKKDLKFLLIGILLLSIVNSISYVVTNNQYKDIKKEMRELKMELDSLKKSPQEELFKKEVTLTCYNPTESQCDNTPFITANGTKIDLEKLKNGKIKYCAVSRDLLKDFPYDSTVYIEGYGEYKVVDTMNKRIINTIDILQDETKPIFKLFNVIITKLS